MTMVMRICSSDTAVRQHTSAAVEAVKAKRRSMMKQAPHVLAAAALTALRRSASCA